MPMDGRTQRTQLSRLNIERTAPQATGRLKTAANAMLGLVGVALSEFFTLLAGASNRPYGREEKISVLPLIQDAINGLCDAPPFSLPPIYAGEKFL